MERRFDVDDDAATPPSFSGVAGVLREDRLPSQSLEAVYFDTASNDLTARHITLRRRTGGTDPGWQLKLPAGPDARAPLDTDAPPAELTDVVLAIIRDRPLAPIARIMTVRDVTLLRGADGAVLAEFCDDHVTHATVSEQHWREWKLTATPELQDQLSPMLFAGGAMPARHSSKLQRALALPTSSQPPDARAGLDPVHRAVAEQVEALLGWDRAVRDDADDAVHQMRVTIRRIRSLLGATRVDDDLRWLAGLLGVARDVEVLAQRYRLELDRLPPQLVRGRVAERLVDANVQRYRDGWRQALEAMRSPRYFRLLDGLDALIAEPAADVPETPTTVDAAYRRVSKAARTATRADQDHDEALHRIRKAAKRLRYIAAATEAPQVVARAKAIQTLLGDHQDSVVSRVHLLQQAEAAHAAGEDTFTYGLLYQQEADLADRRRAQSDLALDELAEAMRELLETGGFRPRLHPQS